MSTCALLPVDFTAQSLSRVTSATLDPSKHWYLLLKEVCGVPLRKFFIRDVFRIFPNEIQSVAARELQPAKSSFGVVEMDRIPDVVHVVSTFGLVAGLLRNKKIPDELINSAGFMAIVNLVNSATLDFESEGAKKFVFWRQNQSRLRGARFLAYRKISQNKFPWSGIEVTPSTDFPSRFEHGGKFRRFFPP